MITVCATEPPLVFESVLNAFVFVLFLFLFILSLLTASVPSSLFRREGLATYKAVVLIILPTPALFLGRLAIFLSSNGFQYQALLWLDFCWISVLPIILMLVLFAPIVSSNYSLYLSLSLSPLSSLSLSLSLLFSLSLCPYFIDHCSL